MILTNTSNIAESFLHGVFLYLFAGLPVILSLIQPIRLNKTVKHLRDDFYIAIISHIAFVFLFTFLYGSLIYDFVNDTGIIIGNSFPVVIGAFAYTLLLIGTATYTFYTYSQVKKANHTENGMAHLI